MKLILKCTVGSRLYGVETPESDYDQAGIFLEDPENILGLTSHEHEISNDGINDISLYSLKKWARLVINGNPSTTSFLWLKPQQCSVWTDIFKKIQDAKHLFLSQKTVDAYLGYAQGQLHRIKGEKGGRRKPSRQELIEKFGYDTKYAMHLIRLGLECLQLIHSKEIIYPLEDESCHLLKSIRNGEFTLNEIEENSQELDRLIREDRANCWLPDKPAITEIDRLLVNIYKDHIK